MSSMLLNSNSIYVERMKKESGDRECPIWLIVNPKYPNDIYNIWTPILYEIQDLVYRKLQARINRENIFIIQAVSDVGRVSNSSNYWIGETAKEIVTLRENILKYQPRLLITFGSITNEFVRRIFAPARPENGPKYWNTSNLEDEFERSITNFDITRTNWIPLLRPVSKNGRVMKDWEDSENYYQEVATKLAERIIENKDKLKIWI